MGRAIVQLSSVTGLPPIAWARAAADEWCKSHFDSADLYTALKDLEITNNSQESLVRKVLISTLQALAMAEEQRNFSAANPKETFARPPQSKSPTPKSLSLTPKASASAKSPTPKASSKSPTPKASAKSTMQKQLH